MVSPLSGGNPLYRTAYFIKPCMEDSTRLPHSTFSFGRTAITSNDAKLPSLEVRYNGWHYPQEEWKTWVQQIQHKYEYLWIRAGIDQAIKASTYQICRNDELILELAQRWCSKTNTFMFLWGEATITLEDVKVCWGYSVVGAPISSPLVSDEEREIEQELIKVFRMFFKTKAKRADHYPWMKHFMRTESHVEHEAFLSLWLSRFVFPGRSHKAILKSVFPIAIHLAKGTKLALAPAVLASIYRDLSLLNNKIRTVTTTTELEVILWAPIQLVQVWALERFPALEPRFHVIEQGQFMMAKWHTAKMTKRDNLKLILDSSKARNGFIWRPYKNSPPLQLCNKEGMWVCDNPNFNDELESFTRCLRVSELVGMECVEHYCPNRVAMQFGMDQDIPAMLTRYNENPWMSYSQLVSDKNLLTALSSCHRPNVTSRYYRWWKQSNPSKEGDMHDHCVVSSSEHLLLTLPSVKKEGEGSFGPPPGFTSKTLPSVKKEGEEGEGSYGPPPGFTSNVKREQEDFDEVGELSIVELSEASSEVRCLGDDEVGNGKALASPLSAVFPSSSVEGARNAKDDENRVKMENLFCDKDGVSDMEMEDASPCTANIAFDLESRIGKLERVIAKLKAAKIGPRVQNVRVKADK
ncbi:hypothetical protein CR513_49155, partial [Mucuna pruriens]